MAKNREIQAARQLGVKCECPDCLEKITRHYKPRPIDWWTALVREKIEIENRIKVLKKV